MRTNNSARAIIVKNGRIAVIHRINNGREYYTTPGGGVEEGESLVEALEREIKEETGLKLITSKLVFTEEWNNTNFYYFRCEVEGDDLVLSGPEANPYKDQYYNPEWINIDDNNKIKMLMPPKVREYLVK